MMKLYEISQMLIDLMNAIDNGEIPEDCITDTLDGLEGTYEIKIDNIASLIKTLNAEAKAIKAEEATLAERRRVKENRAESLKIYVSNSMQLTGKMKIETARNVLSFRKSKSLQIGNEGTFIEWAKQARNELLTYKAPTINKKFVTDLIKGGESIEGAQIIEKQNLQVK